MEAKLGTEQKFGNCHSCITGFMCVCFGSQAFVKMPTMESVHNLITKAGGEEKMAFKGAKISFHVLGFDNPTSPVSTILMLIQIMAII